MTAKFIEEIIKDLPNEDLCFVWVSIGKGDLHLQSKRSLEEVFSGAPKVSLVEEEFTGSREKIARNEIVVVNWEKLRSKNRATGEWKNKLMKDGEKINFRDVMAKEILGGLDKWFDELSTNPKSNISINVQNNIKYISQKDISGKPFGNNIVGLNIPVSGSILNNLNEPDQHA